MKYAYLYETRGIQRFLFATGKLKDMLEGSELIDYICADNGLLDETLQSLDLADKVTSPRRAGGAFYLVFDNLANAQRFQAVWRVLMSQWLPTLEQVDVISQADSAKQAISDGLNKLAKERNRVSVNLPNATPITERSPRTGQAVVRREKYGASGLESLDASTSILRQFVRPAESHSITTRFLDTASLDEGQTIFFPNNFESDAKENKKFPLGRRGLVGLIHADGNGLGEILRLLNEACKNASDEVYVDLYRSFSEGMSRATIGATDQATKSVLLSQINDKGVIPARPLVLGGDDLSVIVKADLAIDFTQAFLTAFKQTSETELAELKQKFIDNGLADSADKLPSYLTACAGIVYMKSSQPFYQAYELAEGLCKQAKTYSRQYKQTIDNVPIIPSSLSFYKIRDSMIEDLDMMLENSLSVQHGTDSYQLSMPAYMVDDTVESVASLEQLMRLTDLLEGNSAINNRPLREVATLMHLNLEQAKQTYLRWVQYSKRSEDQIEKLSKNEKRAVRQINQFKHQLSSMVGELQDDLPFSKRANQSVLADLLTLTTINEEKTATSQVTDNKAMKGEA